MNMTKSPIDEIMQEDMKCLEHLLLRFLDAHIKYIDKSTASAVQNARFALKYELKKAKWEEKE